MIVSFPGILIALIKIDKVLKKNVYCLQTKKSPYFRLLGINILYKHSP